VLAPAIDLRQRGVERRPPRHALGEDRGRVLALVEERLACELLGACEVGLGNRRGGDQGLGLSHAGFSVQECV
jgi:hypothetical protein